MLNNCRGRGLCVELLKRGRGNYVLNNCRGRGLCVELLKRGRGNYVLNNCRGRGLCVELLQEGEGAVRYCKGVGGGGGGAFVLNYHSRYSVNRQIKHPTCFGNSRNYQGI